MEHFLIQLFIFLVAASIAVPVAKKIGFGSVLGYLIAGTIIGPFGLSLIHDVEEVMHFTEFGVVMMLFLIGLELKPALLWKMRNKILGMGGMQVFVSSGVIGVSAFQYLPLKQSIAIGLILSLSSTAIVLQTMREKGIMNTSVGKNIFSVLLFQDLAVIPVIAILPLLSTIDVSENMVKSSSFFDINTLPVSSQIIVTILSIIFIFLFGKYASRPVFRMIAYSRVREIFVAAVLALVVGIELLMKAVGLSSALGAFLAGIVLADSEYRHEIESDIEPFKGLLLGIFFISIGASLNFTVISEKFLLISGIAAAIISFKWLILVFTGSIFKMLKHERALFSLALAQGGEFAFFLFQFSRVNGVLSDLVIDPLISAVAVSMFLTPLSFMLYDWLYTDIKDESTRETDVINQSGHKVILAGFGRVGIDLGRFLISAGIKPVIIDYDAYNIEILRKYGFKVYYGDITRLDLLESAGVSEAELLIITISDIDKSRILIELVKKYYPELKIAVIAKNRSAAYELMELGVSSLQSETFSSALALGKDSLELLGYDSYDAYRLMRIFRKKDEEMLPELYRIKKECKDKYIYYFQQHSADLEKLMTIHSDTDLDELDKAWNASNRDK